VDREWVKAAFAAPRHRVQIVVVLVLIHQGAVFRLGLCQNADRFPVFGQHVRGIHLIGVGVRDFDHEAQRLAIGAQTNAIRVFLWQDLVEGSVRRCNIIGEVLGCKLLVIEWRSSIGAGCAGVPIVTYTVLMMSWRLMAWESPMRKSLFWKILRNSASLWSDSA